MNKAQIKSLINICHLRIEELVKMRCSALNEFASGDLYVRITEVEKLISELEMMGSEIDRGYYKDLYENEGLVSAVKAIRKHSGMGLSDSKKTIDKWAEEGNWNKKVH